MSTTQRSPGRVLAPMALVAFGLAALLIFATAGDGGDGASKEKATQQEKRDLQVQAGEKRRRERQAREAKVPEDVYVVQTGDTLGAIAERTGVRVERLQELNPELDPQALVSGQKIKLKE